MKRRQLLRNLSFLPFAGGIFGSIAPFESAKANSRSRGKRDLYKELGVRTFINAAGTYTFMTGFINARLRS
jgi:L-seryl-tRNA(Ser) seleniumtransferase